MLLLLGNEPERVPVRAGAVVAPERLQRLEPHPARVALVGHAQVRL
jgi:hypothetical protein